jgi:hypothetical protein
LLQEENHYPKIVLCRVSKSSQCVFYQAHDVTGICRVAPLIRHTTTNCFVVCRDHYIPRKWSRAFCVHTTGVECGNWSWPLLFAVSQKRTHDDYNSSPCAFFLAHGKVVVRRVLFFDTR